MNFFHQFQENYKYVLMINMYNVTIYQLIIFINCHHHFVVGLLSYSVGSTRCTDIARCLTSISWFKRLNITRKLLNNHMSWISQHELGDFPDLADCSQNFEIGYSLSSILNYLNSTISLNNYIWWNDYQFQVISLSSI